MWSIWWADLRLTNPDRTQKDLIRISKEKIEKSSMDFTEFIRNYGSFVQNNRLDILTKFNLPKKVVTSLLRKTKKDSNKQFESFKELVNKLDLVMVD